jgi:hypothetical protein
MVEAFSSKPLAFLSCPKQSPFRERVVRGTLHTKLIMAVAGLCGLALVGCSSGPEHELRDIDGVTYGSLERPAEGEWNVLFFVTAACPISNQYAPEIQRICSAYGSKGARCFLVYADPALTAGEVRKHVAAFGHTSPAILDSRLQLTRAAGATVTPEAAVFSKTGSLMYRGRINDFYASLGRPRQRVTQHDLRDALDDLAAGRGVRNARSQATGCFIPVEEEL